MRRWFPPWAVAALIGMAIGTVWLRLWIIRTTYSISQTDRMIHNLREEKERTDLKLAGLRSPRKLEPVARAKFGLAQPRSDQVIYLK